MVRRKIIRNFRSWRHKKRLVLDDGLSEISFPYSKGWGFCAESNGGISNIFDKTEAVLSKRRFSKIYEKNRSSYWLRMGSAAFPHLDYFAELILPLQRVPFVIFCSDGDLTFPVDANLNSVNIIVSHPLFRGFYAQNLDKAARQIDKFWHIPIGLDLHTPRSDGFGSSLFEGYGIVSESAPSFEDRQSCIFSDVNLNHTNEIRSIAFELLRENTMYSFLAQRVSQLELWRQYSLHKYVLSLPGNGHDCHRTWEALGLGCRVITVTSPINDVLNGFPVFIANNIEEIAEDGFYERIEEFFSERDYSKCDISFQQFYNT